MICMLVIPTSSTPKDLDSQKIIATQKSNQYYTIKSYPVKKYRGKTVIDRNLKRGSFFGGKLYKNTFENGWITDDDGNYNADINGSIKVLTDNNKQYKVKNEYTYITNKKTTDPHKKYSMKVITADVKSDIKDRNIKEFAKENNIKAAVFITIYHYQKPVHWKNINQLNITDLISDIKIRYSNLMNTLFFMLKLSSDIIKILQNSRIIDANIFYWIKFRKRE